MLAAQRQARILEEVQRAGAVRVTDLTALFGVSDMTVRRDLDELDQQGLLVKVHGGATARRPGSTDEPAFTVKAGMEQSAKDAIARKAAALVRPGTAIGISAGSTTYTLARHLLEIPGLTVVTNSLRVAEVLHAHQDTNPGVGQSVILTGGMRTPSDALAGPLAMQAIRTLHLDQVFVGVHGMDTRAGFTSPNLAESEANRALVAAARSLVVVADHTKWGVIGLSAFADLHEASVLVTDDGLSEDARKTLSEEVGELLIADRTGNR